MLITRKIIREFMKFGIVPREWGYFVEESVEQCILAKRVGFSSIWIEEHHGNEYYLPSPLPTLAGLSQHVPGMMIGTSIAILPLYHPVRFASDGAILDQLSGGRFIAGVGAGYREHELKLFGIPMSERAGRMDESLIIIAKLWEGEVVNFKGKYYSLENFRLTPLPIQKPRPQIWVGGWVKQAIERAARLGDAWFPGPSGTISFIEENLEFYKKCLEKYGKKFNGFPIMRDAYVAVSDDIAVREAEESINYMYGIDYAKTEHPLLKGKQLNIDEWITDRLLIGSPSTIIEQIDRLRKMGVNHLILRLSLRKLSHSKIMESIKLFGEKIIPYFK